MSNFENKLNQNNAPDIGKIIDESFATFKKTVWISGAGILLLLLIIMPITFFAYLNIWIFHQQRNLLKKVKL